MSYIYQIKNKINNKIYIGSSIDYEYRWKTHIRELNNKKHINNHLQNAWNKYGEENFVFSILCECLDEEQYSTEQMYLDKLSPYNDKGYNISKTAMGGGVYGENCSMSIYSNNQIEDCKNLIATTNMTNKEISEITNIQKHTVSQIRNCKAWNNVASQYNNDILNKKRSGVKLSEEDYHDIYLRVLNGEDHKNIANEYNIEGRGYVLVIFKKYYAIKKGYIFVCKKCKAEHPMELINVKGEYVPKKGYSNRKYCKECAKQINKNNNSKRNIANKEITNGN